MVSLDHRKDTVGVDYKPKLPVREHRTRYCFSTLPCICRQPVLSCYGKREGTAAALVESHAAVRACAKHMAPGFVLPRRRTSSRECKELLSRTSHGNHTIEQTPSPQSIINHHQPACPSQVHCCLVLPVWHQHCLKHNVQPLDTLKNPTYSQASQSLKALNLYTPHTALIMHTRLGLLHTLLLPLLPLY